MNDDLLKLIRNHLDREAESVDPRLAFARLRGTAASIQKRNYWRFGSLACLAAALLAAVAFWPSTPARADPAAIVADARVTHHQPLDRVYLVETQREPAEDGPPPRVRRLYTRGDRFWVEGGPMPGPVWSCGQDDSGAFWLTIGPRRGLRLAADEVPRWLTVWCDFHALRPETFLNQLLRDFTLHREEPASGSTSVIIDAERKSGSPPLPLKHARLEIDRESKVLRKVVLDREFPEGGSLTTTYTLIDTRDEDDQRYELETHLTAPYEVFTKAHEPGKRREILERMFGPRARPGLRGENKGAPRP